MNVDRHSDLVNIFHAVCDLELRMRSSRLDELCGDNIELRAQIEALLARDAEQTGFLAKPALENPSAVLRGHEPHSRRTELEWAPEGAPAIIGSKSSGPARRSIEFSSGDQINQYVVREFLGEGGFADVYLAEQTEPVKRRVALKIIKLGMDTRHVLARFEAERQALAMMDHSNVARVFDAGVTADGRPFFVMEYVAGEPITDHCDRQRLGIDERLRLFIQVCQAVQHAHQKGIIHRDLKPSNILVAANEDEVLAKVIDFGIAKALHQKLTERTVFTERGHFIGTPEYMSPEQAEMTAQDIDTRSDIYSLGVLLYELLIGALPFDPSMLRQAAFGEIQRIIREERPEKPSTRLSALGDACRTNANNRRLDAHSLKRELRGDLDWIVMKTLEKDRDRRYETANGLAHDLERHLNSEPVLAGPPSATYRLRKWIQRNRTVFASISSIAAALVVATVVSIVFVIQAKFAADDLEIEVGQRRTAEQQALVEATAARVARDAAIGAQEESESRTYFASIFAARLAIEANEMASVRRFLDRAPVRHRNWEWHYLEASSDGSVVILEGGGLASFSPDGSRILTTGGKMPRVWDAVTGEEVARLLGHESVVVAGSFSLDGSRIATASYDGTARVWDVATGEETAVLRVHESPVTTASFSPDGSHIVTASNGVRLVTSSGRLTMGIDRAAQVWNVVTGEVVALLAGHKDSVETAVFSPDGSRIVTASKDGTARVWDAASGEELFVLVGHQRSVEVASFNLDGSLVVTGSSDRTARVWDVETGAQLAVLRGHKRSITSTLFSPNGSRIVTASHDGTARVWDAANGEEIAVVSGHDDTVWAASFSPDGSRIITASDDRTARVSNGETGEVVTILRGHQRSVASASFGPNGKRIVTGSTSGAARVWDVAMVEETAILRGHQGPVGGASFSPDGSRIITTSVDRTARLWHTTTREQLAVLRVDGARVRGAVRTATFSPDGTHIVTGSVDGAARVWDAATGEEVAVMRVDDSPVTTASFSPDGSRIVTAVTTRRQDDATGFLIAVDDNAARVWDASSGAEIFVLAGHEDVIGAASFSPDGSRIVTASEDETARVWSAATGEGLLVLAGHEDSVRAASFSPDGSRIVTASRDGTARVWDAATGEEVTVLRGHDQQLLGVSFNQDASHIVTSSFDGTARVWKAATGEEVAVLHGHDGVVRVASFSPDGSRIVTASDDRTARVWDAVTGEEVAVLRGHHDIVWAASFSPDGSRIVTGSEDGTARVWGCSSWRERRVELDRYRRAVALIAPHIDKMLADGTVPTRIAEQIRENQSLTPAQRRAALTLLLKRCDALRR